MLQNDFFSFTVPQIEGNTIKTTLELNAAHKIFEGHFPQHPIVPGVCMMQMVKEVVENVIGKETNLFIAHNIKFLTIIDPRENKTVLLDYKFSMRKAIIKNDVCFDIDYRSGSSSIYFSIFHY